MKFFQSRSTEHLCRGYVRILKVHFALLVINPIFIIVRVNRWVILFPRIFRRVFYNRIQLLRDEVIYDYIYIHTYTHINTFWVIGEF